MPRWLRLVRAMIGTGLTFAFGVGLLGTILGVAGMLFGGLVLDDLRIVGKFTVVSFIVGVGFSGVLALAARGRSFERLSLGFITALGAGGGFLYFLFIAAANGARVWTPRVAFLNFAILTVLGGGLAAATLILARRARRALQSADDPLALGEGEPAVSLSERERERDVVR